MRRYSSPLVSSVLLISLSLFAISLCSAQVITSCEGTYVLPLTPPSPIQVNVTSLLPVFFSIIVPPIVDATAEQLIVSVEALDLPPSAYPQFNTIFTVDVCPEFECYDVTWNSPFEGCVYDFPIPGPWGPLLDNGTVIMHNGLGPLTLQPPAVASVLTLNAALAPLVAAQLIFAVYFNATNTTLPTTTRVIASATYGSIPSFVDTFLQPSYVNFEPYTAMEETGDAHFYYLTVPPLPSPVAFLDGINVETNATACSANVTRNCADCTNMFLSIASKAELPVLHQPWAPSDGSGIGSFDNIYSSAFISTYYDNATFPGSRVLVWLTGMSGGCNLMFNVSYSWECVYNGCYLNNGLSACNNGVCACDARSLPNSTYPNCLYNVCWQSPDGPMNVTFSGGHCRQQCNNSVPVGPCYDPVCDMKHYQPRWNEGWGCYYVAPPPLWWPFPLVALVFFVTLIGVIIVMNVLAKSRNWGEAETSKRLFNPDETKSAI